ncbi:MAG: hypothetical protein A3H39_18050 [candidate division NC10 bacterium RIFCSPLOWO2_02_FULL_66_22]|nr:MAG: hypothetical protein A3H39_18050 [candidate division NC10 bacterium RIFCSPLOWO2_02_FULL_66_22]
MTGFPSITLGLISIRSVIVMTYPRMALSNLFDVCKAGANIVRFQVRIVGQDFLPGFALSQEAQDALHRYPQASDNGLSSKDSRVGCNAREKFRTCQGFTFLGTVPFYRGTARSIRRMGP